MAHRVAPEAEAELDNIWYTSLRKAAAPGLPTGY
jgi:hypothetical protein